MSGCILWFNKADFVLYSSLMFYGSPRGLNCHELKYKVVFHLHVGLHTTAINCVGSCHRHVSFVYLLSCIPIFGILTSMLLVS